MRVERCEGGMRIVLSARNLKVLLSKLALPDSACTITMDGVFVSAEPDAQHYQGRAPGEMHPVTEQMLLRED
jgi:hypothetical protein